jgi:hypothetical protein
MPMPPEAHRLRPDHLPTPFSAEQIRDGCPAGRTIRIQEDAPGQPPAFRSIRFLEADERGGEQEVQATDAEGNPTSEPSRRRSTWLELQQHASQPADATTVEEVSLDLPFGRFDCWLYAVRRPEGELRFWFAKDLAGMPVQVDEWTDGSLTGRSVMIANEMPAPWGRRVDKEQSALETRG